MQRRAAEESLTDHGKDNSNGRAHVGDAIRHKPGILGFLRQIGFMGATVELEKEKLVAGFETQVGQKKKLVDAYTADRAKLVSAGSEKRAQRHTEIAAAANAIRTKLRRFANQRQTFLALQDEVMRSGPNCDGLQTKGRPSSRFRTR